MIIGYAIGLYIAIGIIAMTVSFYVFAKSVKDNDYSDEKWWAFVSGAIWPVAIVFWIVVGLVSLISNYFDIIIKYSKNS
jgi:purine-cytosine permease-like protein